MNKLALTLPGGNTIDNPVSKNFTDLGSIISSLLNIVFFIAIFTTFYWLVWGAFQYLTAGGNKENLAKARGRIIWALVGLIIIMLSFLAAKYLFEVLQPKGGAPF